MTDNLQIGDVVKHKAKHPMIEIPMTVHYFTEHSHQMGNAELTPQNWAVCQWFNSTTFSYQQATFHINELQKV